MYNYCKHQSMVMHARESGKRTKAEQGSTRLWHNQMSMSSEEGSPSTPLAQTESYSILSAKKSPTLSRSLRMTSASLPSAGFKGMGDFDRGNRVENAS